MSEQAQLADIVPEAETELKIISDELAARDAIAQLCSQMSTGGPKLDTDGVMDLDKVGFNLSQSLTSCLAFYVRLYAHPDRLRFKASRQRFNAANH